VKHDAAIAAFGDVEVDRKFEPVVLTGGHDVAGIVRIDAGECAVLDLPAWSNVSLAKVGPAVQGFAVKE
jgi:hypothetical protein